MDFKCSDFIDIESLFTSYINYPFMRIGIRLVFKIVYHFDIDLFLKTNGCYWGVIEMFNTDELKLIKGCLLTTKETFKMVPFKTNEIKQKIKEIDELLKKF